MKFDSYIVQDTNLSLTMPLNCPPSPKCSHSKGLRRLKGFTLAEVLITLTIIGVIASMTVPTLMSNNQKRVFVTGLKKAYSVLSNAMVMLPISLNCPAGDYDCTGFNSNNFDEDKYKDLNAYRTYMLSQLFKTNKVCVKDNEDIGNCITDEMYLPDESANAVGGAFVTNDGMVFRSSYGGAENNIAFDITVDLNGPKGPNKAGRDIFKFILYTEMGPNGIQKGSVVPFGTKTSSTGYVGSTDCNTPNVNNPNGSNYLRNLSCTARVLEEDDMKY